MSQITVVVHGALGRMGREVISALCQEPDTKVIGDVDLNASGDNLALPDSSGNIPLSTKLTDILVAESPDVLVDFTLAPATMPAVRIASEKKVNLVIGTTGLANSDLEEIDHLTRENGVGAVVAPNFALGAVLMIHLAKIAGKYLDYAEIIELHHHMKVDAPSGTALSTARAMAQARSKPFDTPAEKEERKPSRGEEVEGESGLRCTPLTGIGDLAKDAGVEEEE